MNPELDFQAEIKDWQGRAKIELSRLNHARDIGDEDGQRIHEANLNRAIETYSDIGKAAVRAESPTIEFDVVQ